MLRLASDADANGHIINGLYQRCQEIGVEIDIEQAQDVLPDGTHDRDVLAWAARQNRILITNDRNTMVGFAYERIRDGGMVPGVIVTTNKQPIGEAIDDILLIAGCSTEEEVRDLVVIYLPYR
jgi:hypothetical protein